MTEVIFTDEFDEWYLSNSREIRKKLFMVIGLLKELGTVLPFPYAAKILGAKYNLRELRKEISGRKYRPAGRKGTRRGAKRDRDHGGGDPERRGSPGTAKAGGTLSDAGTAAIFPP